MQTMKSETLTEHNNMGLTASEMGFLWTQYINDSMAICVLKYFAEICEDKEILSVIEYSKGQAHENIQRITDIFNQEELAIPVGFTDDDVNVKAPRLFSDTFILLYLLNMAVVGLNGVCIAIGVSARSDVSEFFHDVMASASNLHKQARIVALNKGVYIRPPFISKPEKVDFVKKQSFLFDMFGKNKRPLSAIEITHLFKNIQTNDIGNTMMMAFAQVCKSDDVKQFFLAGKGISNKHIKKFSTTLTDEDIPSPQGSDAHVMNSTVAPFSDKLMVFHTTEMIAVGMGNYGAASATCHRLDLSAMYARLAAEVALYSEDGANILISHGWFEEPPQADDRKALVDQPK